MSIEQLDPQDACELLECTEGSLYIDVRTPEEFAAGHPDGALNIPIFLKQNGQMVPNVENFRKIVDAVIPKTEALVVGCQAGMRSQAACEHMSQWGYDKLYNVTGGFGGWLQSGLPISTEANDDILYESLLAKAHSPSA